ncbi:hypothetical protein EYR41_002515 [Orbilia oligospora]|uniref:Uncharacterized protein n=1 Tax=Orbilia oligospora TaxID=2813651 RepID=A0A7C8JXB7_ORBOL|nr:hypothetical protein TWF751_004553 [Orbilia oligospora]TGJ70477.1 hypothetical protein EYR41_002515 [Orbilia oligospora]
MVIWEFTIDGHDGKPGLLGPVVSEKVDDRVVVEKIRGTVPFGEFGELAFEAEDTYDQIPGDNPVGCRFAFVVEVVAAEEVAQVVGPRLAVVAVGLRDADVVEAASPKVIKDTNSFTMEDQTPRYCFLCGSNLATIDFCQKYGATSNESIKEALDNGVPRETIKENLSHGTSPGLKARADPGSVAPPKKEKLFLDRCYRYRVRTFSWKCT